MNVFILVLFVKVANAGGLTSMEFNSQADCEAAKQAVLEGLNKKTTLYANAVCIPKGG